MKKNFSLNFDDRHLKRFDSTCWGSPCDAGESACLDFFTSSADSCKDQRDLGAPSKGQRFKQIRFLLGGDVVFALTKVPCLYTLRLFCHLPHDNVHHLTRVHVSGVCSLSAALKPGRKEKSPVFSDLSTDGRLCTWSCCSRLKDGFFFFFTKTSKKSHFVPSRYCCNRGAERGKAEKWLTLHCCYSQCSRASYTLLFRCEWFEFTMRYCVSVN